MTEHERLSIILPAKNEAESLPAVLGKLIALYPAAEIIVVDDGSSDGTDKVSASHGARAVRHPYSMGNGAAVKSGARAARGEILVFMDADGQHDATEIRRLLAKLDEGYDMVVGARSFGSQANVHRAVVNVAYNRIASLMTGFDIKDLTSGFRAVRARRFRQFLYLLPNGFSYPTTSTMAFFRSGYSVAYVPIDARRRDGRGSSSIGLFRDGLRFFIIILKIGALFSPMRLFLPMSFFFFALAVSYYTYTYLTAGRLTNMTAILMITAMLTFLIGIVSEQVSALHYKDTDRDQLEGGGTGVRESDEQDEHQTAADLRRTHSDAWARNISSRS